MILRLQIKFIRNAVILLLCILGQEGVMADTFLANNSSNQSESLFSTRVLHVGKELKGEKLSLNTGNCLYNVQGLEQGKSYEVKISYPASIPARFSIEWLKDGSKSLGRRLLNTEKLMFIADANVLERTGHDIAMAVIRVMAQSDGIVAKRNVQEQPYVFYNILCERVHIGIPQQALWVGLLATIAVIASLFVAPWLPHLLLEKQPPPVKSAKETL